MVRPSIAAPKGTRTRELVPDPKQVRSRQDAALAASFKSIADGTLMIALGVIVMLMSAILLTRNAVNVAAWVWCLAVVVAAVRYMFWGAPEWVWRWLTRPI